MGEGASRTSWHKPSREYQTVKGGRWGRKHSSFGHSSLLGSQDTDAHQEDEDCMQLELEDVQKEDFLAFSKSSSPLVQGYAGLLDEPLSKKAGTRQRICQSMSSQPPEGNTSPLSLYCYGPEGNQDFMNPHENSEDLSEHTPEGRNDLKGKSGITFVTIDSSETDSSDGGEDDTQNRYSWLRKGTGLLQGRRDNIFSQYEKKAGSLTETQQAVFDTNVHRQNWEEAEPMSMECPNSKTVNSAEDQAIPKSSLSGASYGTQQIKHTVDVGFRTPIPTASVLNISDEDSEEDMLVVRRKLRIPNMRLPERANWFLTDREDESDARKRIVNTNVQQLPLKCPLRDGKEEMSSGMFFVSGVHGDQKNTEADPRRNAAAQEQNNVVNDSTFWNERKDYNRRCVISLSDEDSSECSDGEWSTAVLSCSIGMEKEQTSSDESQESSDKSKEESGPEVQSSSGVKEENIDLCFQEGDQTVLEEGEIPCVHSQDEIESSSDEENNSGSDFVSLGFLLLDGNNNLEDDTSGSEDLDMEWRSLDEFGENLGLAQGIPYMGPQFLTLMALGHLEAMEISLAQLQSFVLNVEQSHPPATKETIDGLPQIIVTGDVKGQEQHCIICWNEYVDGETITELPCHHLFHKPCVTRWLQRSGTCPVCRHVLPPVPPDDIVSVSD